ncbi:MAG: hypothetical protein AB8D78_06495 [Akkermansiaceae bacterium]
MDRQPKGSARHSIIGFLATSTLALLLGSCAFKPTPEEAVRIAISYANLEWMPEERHIRHGKDSNGIPVQTPDTTLAEHGDKRGWWKPGRTAKGMAYKWGGFDTPESFLDGLANGKKAGDIANTYKVRNDNAAISNESVGIDCSGFISRCWQLSEHVSTKDLPALCDPVSWDELKMADIILKPGHALMFVERRKDYVVGFESGPIPTWRARQCSIRIDWLKANGYSPWRYREMAEPLPTE